MYNPTKAIVVATLSLGIFSGCSGGPPSNVSGDDGQLAPCPDSPNCVSTMATDEEHGIEPLQFRGSVEETMASIVQVVDSMVRTTIITKQVEYLHAEYRTRIGFVDDVEFLLDSATDTVHFRSASRLGYGDLGVNRARMEEFRTLYKNLP